MVRRNRRILRLTVTAVLAIGLLIYIFLSTSPISSYTHDNYRLIYNKSKITNFVNDSLILMQSKYVLPSNNQKIFGWIKPALFPTDGLENISDRTYSQIRYMPSNYRREEERKYKLILLYNGEKIMNDEGFEDCPVKHCRITNNRNLAPKADVIIWITNVVHPSHVRPPGQVWAFFFHESPLHTPDFRYFEGRANSLINWTITYRPDSTISLPYYFYSPYDLVNKEPDYYPLPQRDYAAGKTKLLAWFVSNCNAKNDRLDIAKKLNEYIQVDIYGKCGKLKCPRDKESECFEMLNKNYKFYLAFENSNCRHYITEKYFENGLNHDVVPIVLGAHPDDYKRVSPPNSYIHVEDFKTKMDLAKYVLYLDRNNTAYNEYFSWKKHGTVRFEKYLQCRLCMLSHETENFISYYTNLYNWWQGDNGSICNNRDRWKQ